MEIRLFNALGYGAYQVTNYDEGREYYSWQNEVMLQYNSKRLTALKDKPYDIHLRISTEGSYLSFSTVVYYTW